ncbi:sugar kinase [Pseudalkalibacillus hwajinpoensis]|uniref:sugar kinase n=1 Tax=Guptibacillus hwajinpoensis TaxID=208199 RepID=UPI001CD48467|nr:sugar kinase [Pseudalkalibacillus hwajinpoensis]MCA0991414.1 sugar kinase [Pseudalkalibacillus hwajinpoensis]
MDVVAIGETLVSLTPKANGLMRHAESFTPKVAGAETNTLMGLSRLGHETGWISRLGDDELGARILTTVRGEGVDTSNVMFDRQHQTGLFFKEMIHGGEVRVHYYRKGSAASHLEMDDLNEDYIANATFLYISGITPALSESCKTVIMRAISIAKEHDTKVVFDPNIRKKLWSEEEARTTLLEISNQSDIVLPGIAEGAFLFGTTDDKEIAQSFLNLDDVSCVVVKRGERGAYYSTPESSGEVDAYEVRNVIDPVGAGDGFAAGFLSGLLDHLSIEKAVERACAVGAMVTTIPGDFEGLPDRARLEQFMSSDQREDVER